MAKIGKSYSFEAAHSLPYHDGQCAKLHGHTYTVSVSLEGDISLEPNSPQYGMVVDFSAIDEIVKPLIKELDHSYLNDVISYPTAELIGVWFLGKLEEAAQIPWSVTVHETAKTFATVTYADLLRTKCKAGA